MRNEYVKLVEDLVTEGLIGEVTSNNQLLGALVDKFVTETNNQDFLKALRSGTINTVTNPSTPYLQDQKIKEALTKLTSGDKTMIVLNNPNDVSVIKKMGLELFNAIKTKIEPKNLEALKKVFNNDSDIAKYFVLVILKLVIYNDIERVKGSDNPKYLADFNEKIKQTNKNFLPSYISAAA